MRAVLQVFENYQKARVQFVQSVAELATRPQVRALPRPRPASSSVCRQSSPHSSPSSDAVSTVRPLDELIRLRGGGWQWRWRGRLRRRRAGP